MGGLGRAVSTSTASTAGDLRAAAAASRDAGYDAKSCGATDRVQTQFCSSGRGKANPARAEANGVATGRRTAGTPQRKLFGKAT